MRDDLLHLQLALPGGIFRCGSGAGGILLQPAGDDFGHRSGQPLRDLLRQISQRKFCWRAHCTAVRLQVAVDQLQQGGLAHAVAPQQAHPLAAFDL